MNDAAELERKRLERFLSGAAGGGKKAPAGSPKTNSGSNGSNGTTSAKPASPSSPSLGSSPSYKHEEKRKWEIKQERSRAQFGVAASTGKKHLEMEDSAAEAAAKRQLGGAGAGSGVNVESYEERERRRRAEWKRQTSPSLALLDMLEGDAVADKFSELKTPTTSTSVKVAGSGTRSASEEAALKELLNYNSESGGAAATPAKKTALKKTKGEASPSHSLSSSSSSGGVRLSPRLEDKAQAADTFAQIGNVLNSLNDLLDDPSSQPAYSYNSVGKVSSGIDALYVSDLPAGPSSSSRPFPATKKESGGKTNAKPKTKEERRREKEARRPEWAQTLYDEFNDETENEEDSARQDYQYVDQQLWRVDLEQEEKESKEFVKDAQNGIQKLEAVSAMIEPDMDVDDFDEERFSLGIKEFVYSGKKTIRYIKRKSKQGSVRMAGEARKFMDDSVALMDTARDYKSSRTEKAKAKFSRTVRKVKDGAQKLTKTVTSAVEDEVERMRELRDKIRAAERDRREREEREAEEREARKASSEREASVTRLSFELDQFLYHIKKIEDDGFRFDYGGAVELLKRVRDVKESVPVLLAYLSGDISKQFVHLNTEITEISTATARFVKDWQAGSSSKAENMRQTGGIVKLSRKFQQDLMDLILFI